MKQFIQYLGSASSCETPRQKSSVVGTNRQPVSAHRLYPAIVQARLRTARGCRVKEHFHRVPNVFVCAGARSTGGFLVLLLFRRRPICSSGSECPPIAWSLPSVQASHGIGLVTYTFPSALHVFRSTARAFGNQLSLGATESRLAPNTENVDTTV